MAKANRYVIDAYDSEGEPILEGLHLTAMTDKAAWSEAVKRAFLKVSEQARQGYLVGRMERLEVTRL
jgi:hypothetical protein